MDAFVIRSRPSTSSDDQDPSLASTSKSTCVDKLPLSSRDLDLPSDLGDNAPAQPRSVKPPKTSFGSQARSFQNKWFKERPWLEYSVKNDACFCFPCRKYLTGNEKDTIFTRDGFRNWKTACETSKGFAKHSSSKAHVLSMTIWNEKQKYVAVGGALEKVCGEQIERNQYYLSRMFELVKFLTTNELAFRGTEEEIGGLHAGLFLKMVEYTQTIDKKFAEISKTILQNAKYTSPQFQNEVISILAELVKRRIIEKVKERDNGLFAIKCDEARDSSGVELLTIVLRFVNKEGQACEKLLGLYDLEQFDAQYIAGTIIQALKEADLNLDFLLAQCYDGASVMSGKHAGVQKRICNEVNRDVPYVHCFNHQLHLIVVHLCEKVDIIRNFFHTCQMLNDFFGRPKVRALYQKSGATALARLMEQRWSGHLKTVKSILDNFDDIISILDSFSGSDFPEMSVIAAGLKKAINQKRFLFVAFLMHEVLSILKPADKLLQSRTSSISTGSQIITETIRQVKEMRTEEQLDKILGKTDEKLNEKEAEKPSAKRARHFPVHMKSLIMIVVASLSIVVITW